MVNVLLQAPGQSGVSVANDAMAEPKVALDPVSTDNLASSDVLLHLTSLECVINDHVLSIHHGNLQTVQLRAVVALRRNHDHVPI